MHYFWLVLIDTALLLLNNSCNCCSNGAIDLNTTTRNGATAFILACQRGLTDVVQWFLNQPKGSIDLNAKDQYGCTGFMRACNSGQSDVVKLILQYAKSKGIEIPLRPHRTTKKIRGLVKNHHKNQASILTVFLKKMREKLRDRPLQQELEDLAPVENLPTQEGETGVENNEENYAPSDTSSVELIIDEADLFADGGQNGENDDVSKEEVL